METTTNSLSVTKEQFDLQTRLFNNVLEEVTDLESDNQLNDKVNHLKWLAGHLTNTRLSMYQIGGFEEDKSFDEFFAHGKAIDKNLNYPTIASIIEKWNEISPKLSNGFKNLPEEMLDSEAPVNVPIADNSMRSFLGFLMHHEAYHLGQMGILRKYIGKEAMSYK